MLRAISEMAAATRVTSAPEKPRPSASSRPCWRAVTISMVDRTSTRLSLFGGLCMLLGLLVQERQSLLEVEGCADPFQGQAQLHHSKSHFGLDAHDHRLGAAEL